MQKEISKLSLKNDIFRIPNLFTLLNIIVGFVSILFIIEQNYSTAGILILLGMVFDFLDGFTAKILNQSSEFGVQLDSFADVLTFGAAPVILVYGTFNLSLNFIFKLSLLIYFISIVYRLSKYNIIRTNKDGTFRGLPSTFSGGFISILTIWFPVFYSNSFSFLLFIFLAFLSMSNIPYKKIKITKIHHTLILLALIVLTIFFEKWVLLFSFIIYFLSGFYNEIKNYIIKNKSKKRL